MKVKLLFYINSYLKSKIPRGLLKWRMHHLRQAKQSEEVLERINYYCKQWSVEESLLAKSIKKYQFSKPSSYHFDLIPYLGYFDQSLKFSYLFGDITHIPQEPTLVKSRPISENNQNSVLFKLNTIRHFRFVKDITAYTDKKEALVWRGNVLDNQKARQQLLNIYFTHPNFNIGHVNDYRDNTWQLKKMSIKEQLKYKFILSIEGNDVATNLKWILSSNSLCFMCAPRFETWFMEGRLVPNHHYVLIKDDFSDLEEKFDYYKAHPTEAQNIIDNAHRFVTQFKNKKQERHISLLVLDKYLNALNA